MSEQGSFEIRMQGQEGYRFEVDFNDPGIAPLWVDEPAPLGEGSGPNASRLLATAVGNCLSASLLFCLRKAHVAPSAVNTTVRGTMMRNEQGRLRIAGFDVAIEVSGEFESQGRFERCLGMFEDFCVVTASVRQGIPVQVSVAMNGTQVYQSAD